MAPTTPAAGKRLTVLVDDTVSYEGNYRTPDRGMATGLQSNGVSSAFLRSPYSGSIAGSTTRERMTPSGRQWHGNDGNRGLARAGSCHMLGEGNELSSSASIVTIGSSGKIRTPASWYGKKKLVKNPLVAMMFLVTLGIGVFGVYFSSMNTKSWSSGGDGRHGSHGTNGDYGTEMRGDVFHTRSDYDKLMAALPAENWNAKRKCLSNEEYVEKNDLGLQHATGAMDGLPELVEIHSWASRKEVKGNSISLVTQLSANRIPNLEDQCLSWPDKIVAAIYVPMTTNSSGGLPLLPGYPSTTLDDMIRGIGSFHSFMENTAVCSLDIIFLGQFINKPDVPGAYPVNALRNKALSLVRTELSIHTNVDIVLNPLFVDRLGDKGYKDDEEYTKLVVAARKKTAFLLPTVELSNLGQDLKIVRNLARSHALSGKRLTKEYINKKMITSYVSPEDLERGTENVFQIDLQKWIKTSAKDGHLLLQSGSRGSPRVSSMSEPCILLSTELTPWFDERFVDNGYGANVWLHVLEHAKFKFRMHATGFGVHVSHRRPVPKSRYLVHRQEFRQEVMGFLNSTLARDIQKGIFLPITSSCGTFSATMDESLGLEQENAGLID